DSVHAPERLALPHPFAGADQPPRPSRHHVEPGPRRAPRRVVRRPRVGGARLGTAARPGRVRVPATGGAVSERSLAGRWDPRGGGVRAEALADAIRLDDEPGALERGPFALAWTQDRSPASGFSEV